MSEKTQNLEAALKWFAERVTIRKEGMLVLVEPIESKWAYGMWCQFPAHLEETLRRVLP